MIEKNILHLDCWLISVMEKCDCLLAVRIILLPLKKNFANINFMHVITYSYSVYNSTSRLFYVLGELNISSLDL